MLQLRDWLSQPFIVVKCCLASKKLIPVCRTLVNLTTSMKARQQPRQSRSMTSGSGQVLISGSRPESRMNDDIGYWGVDESDS